MRKMCRHALGLYLTLLILIMTACGGYEDPVPDASPVYEADVHTLETEEPVEEISAVSQEDTAADVVEDVFQSPDPEEDASESPNPDVAADLPAYGSYYYDLENVVLYLEVYDELPPNYITKNEARKLGWEGGSVEKYREGAAIGGDSFGNREGILPEADGRSYTECDIDTDGYNSRGSRRLVFSNDGLYFYTSDHYETFSEVTVTEDYEVIW